MFGLMKRAERLAYCGSSKTIGAMYGQRARLLPNDDMVFLGAKVDAEGVSSSALVYGYGAVEGILFLRLVGGRPAGCGLRIFFGEDDSEREARAVSPADVAESTDWATEMIFC